VSTSEFGSDTGDSTLGGTEGICTMLLHLGQAKICPSKSGRLTMSFDLQVTQWMEKDSIASLSRQSGALDNGAGLRRRLAFCLFYENRR